MTGTPTAGRTARRSQRTGPRARPRVRGDRDSPESEAAVAAQLAVRAAALLRGGVAVPRVFDALRADARVARIAERVAGGNRIPDAIAAEGAPPWRVLAVAWQLAETSGAPLALALERIGRALRELERLGERRDVLLSGPRATVRLVSALPLGTLGLGALLGFNPLPIFASIPGAALCAAGTVLLATGVMWARAMRTRVERADRVDGIECELLWIATGGGSAPAEARVRAVDAIDAYGARWVGLERFCAGGTLAATIAAAHDTGVPLRPLLLEEASHGRARAHAELERAAERLGVLVLLPLGLCVLPASIALGVAPVVLSMLGGV